MEHEPPAERPDDRVERHYEAVKGFPARDSFTSVAATLGVAVGWVALGLGAVVALANAGVSSSTAAWLGIAAIVGVPLLVAVVTGPGKDALNPVIITARKVAPGQAIQVDVRFHEPVNDVAFVVTERVRSFSQNRVFDQKRVIDVSLAPVVVDGDPDVVSYRGTVPRAASIAGRWYVAVEIGRGLSSRTLAYPLRGFTTS